MDISVMLSSLAGAKDLASALFNERDRQKAAAIQIDLTEKILQAQAQLAEVLAAIISKDAALQALTEANRQLRAAQDERSRYELAVLRADGHALAYRLRPAGELVERRNEPAHFLCQPCFDAGKKSVLVGDEFAGSRIWTCSLCKAVLTADRV